MDQIVDDLISNTIPKYLVGDALHETLLSPFECPGWNEYLNGGMTGTVGILVEHDVDAEQTIADPFRKIVTVHRDDHDVVTHVIDHPIHMFLLRLPGGIGEHADHLSALKAVRLVELICTLYFNDETLTRADIIAPQPDRIPARPVLNPAIKRRQQNLLPVLLQVFLAFFADQFERVL